MERDKTKQPRAESVDEEEMDTSGHGDALQDAVDRIAKPEERKPEGEPRLERVDEEDMDTKAHGDPRRIP